MKINETNHLKLNAYQNLIQKPTKHHEKVEKSNQLETSNEAKSMTQKHQPDKTREKHIQAIKEIVQSVTYENDFEKTAHKMIDYWTKDRYGRMASMSINP